MVTSPPLDLDLSTVKTDFPLLADGHYELVLKKSEVSTSSKGGEMWKLEMQTIGPARSRPDPIHPSGEDLPPGTTVFDQAMLAPSGKSTWEIVQRNVGAIIQALGVTGVNLGNIKQHIPTFAGRTLKVQIGHEPAKDGYREKNVVAKYVKAGQAS